jgi:hypothetical protein
MNELQIRLTADIKDLQSALAKVKQTLKSFESEATTDIAKSNKERQRTLGLIEEQIAKSKTLKVSIAQATNEKQIAGFNAELEQTNIELARLNALGKTFSAPAVRSFDNLKKSSGAATSSAIAFGRIIQDAPFGIMGVANNIQNFSEQFVALGGKATSTGAKLKMFFSALIQPTSLAVLAISALTAGWQAYQMGTFDSLFATESLSDSLKELSENTKSATANAGVELIKLNNLKDVIEDETISRDKRLLAVNQLIDTYPKLFSLADREKLLNGQLVKSYEILTKAIVAKAKASIAEQELPELIKQKEIVDLQLKAREDLLAVEEESLKTASRLTSITEAFSGSEYEQVGRRVNTLKSEVEELTLRQGELKINIDGYTQSIVSYANEYEQFIGESSKSLADAAKQVEFYDQVWNENEKRLQRIIELTRTIADEIPDRSLASVIAFPESDPNQFKPTQEVADVVPLGKIEELEKQIALFESLKRATQDTDQITLYSLAIANLRNQLASLNGEQVKSNLELIADAFGSMGQQIANSLNISNRSLRGFVTTLVSATPKIISAIMAQAAANAAKAAADKTANLSQASGNVIVSATEAAKGLGPVGLALLPVFIAGALALVSSAFGKAGGGGGSVSAGQGSTFTNRREFGGPVSKGRAYIVGEKRPELFVPNTNGIIVPQVPSMDYSGASMAAGAMAVDVNIRGVSYGDDILFTVQQAQIRRGIR